MIYYESNCLAHHGIKGQHWGVRRYQNPDGTLTEAGKRRNDRAVRAFDRYKGKLAKKDSRAEKRMHRAEKRAFSHLSIRDAAVPFRRGIRSRYAGDKVAYKASRFVDRQLKKGLPLNDEVRNLAQRYKDRTDNLINSLYSAALYDEIKR